MSHKAVFLDRDGVINEERKDYVKDLNEFKIIDDSIEAIKLLKQNNFHVVVITNQSAVNRGLLSLEKLSEIHKFLELKLNENNTCVDGIYFCPHHSDDGCNCRKPKPGLLLKAALDLDLDLGNSWMIGDMEKDLEAAKAAGCRGILLNQNKKLLDAVKEIIFSS